MAVSYEQWEIILGIINQEGDLSKDNVIEKIKELLKTARILEREEVSKMLEEVSHKLETSSKIPRAQETQEPLKKRLKVVNVPQTLEESKKILKEQGVSNAKKILERVLKGLGVQKTLEESKAVALEDILNVRKTSEKMPVMLDTQKILEAIETLKKASKDVYNEWEKAGFDVNYWFTIDYNIRSGYDQYPLLCLAMDFKLENVAKALKRVKGMDARSKGPFSQWTALHWAAENEDTKSLSELVDNGADVNSQDSFGQTPLYPAAINGNIKIIKPLVQNGADVNKEDITKSNPLYEATDHNNIEAVEYLMTQRAKVKASKKFKRTPLHAAIKNGNKKMLMCITEGDRNIDNDIDIVNIGGKTALYEAIERNDISLLDILLRKGADVNLEDDSIGQSPLHVAATNGNVEAVRLLIYYGANINYRDASGWTPFDCVFAKNDVQMMNVLIAHGANINIKDSRKILSLLRSCNFFEIRHTLVQLEIYDEVMKLARAEDLRYAAKCGNIQMAHDLLTFRVNVNASDDLGLTALHEAAKSGHREVAELLILCGAAVNARDSLGITPLSYATQNRRWGVVEVLMLHNADLSLQDHCGETVRDLAESKNTSKILDAIEETIQIDRTTRVKSNTEFCEGRVTPLANGVARMQLEPSTKLNMVEDGQASLSSIIAMQNMCTRIENMIIL